MESIQSEAFGQPCHELISAASLCELGPGTPNADVRGALEALTPSRVLDGHVPKDEQMARCCMAGLWLLHNYLDESHQISQSIETPSGNYWHGLLHRREPDYSNAKYWFRRVGEHPIHPELLASAQQLAGTDPDPEVAKLTQQAHWNAGEFVDVCEHAAHGKTTIKDLCRQIAFAEWQHLFSYCYRHALPDQD